MAGSLERVLQVMECLSKTSSKGITSAEVCEQTGLASSTVYRMLNELEKAGYLYKGPGRTLLPNYTFERRISFGTFGPEQLLDACLQISRTLQTASEVILLKGPNLLWHHKEEHPNQALSLRAHAGFVRGTYEMDSISRLSLAHKTIDDIERNWDLTSFYGVGVAGKKALWPDVRANLLAINPDEMEFDIQGNAKGVRRFCVAVKDIDGTFICLLTVAEAAVPLGDETQHISNIRNVLMNARASLFSKHEEDTTPTRQFVGMG